MGNIFLIVILFAQRLFFLSPLPIYFDSPEYVGLIQNPSLIHALTQGHEPIHPGYILPAWILTRIFPFLGALYSAEIISSFFGALGLFVFYKIVKLLFDKNLAIRALIFISFLPVFFLASTNVLTDTTYIFFYLLSFYFLVRYFKEKSNKWFWFGILSLAYSIFTHTQVILWLPVFLTPVILEKKKKLHVFKRIAAFLTLGVTLGVFFLVFLLMQVGNTPIQGVQLLFMHGADIYGTGDTLYDLARFIRNFGIILLRNNSILVVFAAVIGSFLLYKKDKKKLFFLMIWFFPTLITTQYWHIGLFGRVALIASFPLAIAASFVPRVVYIIVVLQLVIMFVPIAFINRNAPVQKELVSIYKKIPKEAVLVSSNLIRPQVVFSGEKYFINEPGQDLEFIKQRIDLALKNNRSVYVDSQALYNPYYTYDGNHLHVLSLGKAGNSEIKPLFNKYSMSVIETSDNPRIFLYKINPISQSKTDLKSYRFVYSDDFGSRVHKERIDNLDIGTWVWTLLTNKKVPIFWKL